MVTAIHWIANEQRRIEVAGQNLVNSATPGYRRQIAFQDVLQATNAEVNGGQGLPSITQKMATDFTPGKLIHTGRALDLAVGGTGFFEVRMPDGPAYTRQGALQRDADGRLVTAQGYPLQAKGGGDVVVPAGDWRVDGDGTVLSQGHPVAAIRIVDFRETAKLVRIGQDMFRASGGQAPEDVDGSRIEQGYLEAANTVTGADMIQMMESMRRIESAQKVVHVYDDMIGNVLQRLGGM